jgi:hypothetical protein
MNFPIQGLDLDKDEILNVKVELMNTQIPVSFYNINYTNNILKYQVLGVVYTITLTRGNYSGYSLIEELKTQFLTNGHSFTITINKNNGCISFNCNNLEIFFNNGSTILDVLGFENNDVPMIVINSSNNHILIQQYYRWNMSTIYEYQSINYDVPAGIYTVNEFVDCLNSVFMTDFLYIITATYDSITKKISISQGPEAYDYFELDSSSTIASTIGFPANTTIRSVNLSMTGTEPINTINCIITYAGATTSPFPINLLSITALVIKSQALQTFSYSNNRTNNILSTISVDKSQFQLINYQSQGDNKIPISNRVLDNIDIQIYDQNDNFINFNNQNWTITLGISMIKLYNPRSLDKFRDIVKNNQPTYNQPTDLGKNEHTDETLDLLTSP